MDEEELLLQGDDGAAVITDHLDEEQLLNESINGDAGSVAGESAGVVCKIESLDHEELDYEEDEEKEERESRFTSERAKKSPVRAPEDGAATDAKVNENTGIASRGSYRGRVMRGGAGFRGGMGGNFNTRGGMRMVAGGGSAGPISLLTSNIPPPMMMAGPGMGGPFGKILVNPNFPVGAGLTLLPTPGPGGYGAPPMGLGGPMAAQGVLGPKVTLSIDGAPALAVPVNVPPPQMQMGPGPGVSMSMPPPNLTMRPGGQGPLGLNPMTAPPPSVMRFPPGMGPPPMNVGMNVPPPGMAPQMAGGPAGNWNLMVEAFLGDKKAAGERSKKKRRRRSRSSSYSSSSDSESSYSESSRSRSRSRSPRKSRKRSSRGSRKDRRKERSGRGDNKADRGGERRVFRTGPNAYRINNASSNGAELPSLLDGIDRGSSGKDSRSRRADRERQRENDSRDSARALGLDEEYLSRVEEQRRQREEMRRRRERNDGGASRNEPTTGTNRDRSSNTGRSRHDSNGNGAPAKETRKKPESATDESKRKAYLAVHVKNVSNLGEAALGRVKALANEVGETKKVWRSADDVVTVIFVELDKAKAFMLKYNGKVLSGLRITVGLEKVYLNLSEVHDR